MAPTTPESAAIAASNPPYTASVTIPIPTTPGSLTYSPNPWKITRPSSPPVNSTSASAAAVDLANFIESASSIPGTHHSEPLPANTHRNNTGNDSNSATEHTCSNPSIKDP